MNASEKLTQKTYHQKNKLKSRQKLDIKPTIDKILDSVKQPLYSNVDIINLAEYLSAKFYTTINNRNIRIFVMPNIVNGSLKVSVYDTCCCTYSDNHVREIYTITVHLTAGETETDETRNLTDLLISLYGIDDKFAIRSATKYLKNHSVTPSAIRIDQYPILANWYKSYRTREEDEHVKRQTYFQRIRPLFIRMLGESCGRITYRSFRSSTLVTRPELRNVPDEIFLEAAKTYKDHGCMSHGIFSFSRTLLRILSERNLMSVPDGEFGRQHMTDLVAPIVKETEIVNVCDTIHRTLYRHPDWKRSATYSIIAEAVAIWRDHGFVKTPYDPYAFAAILKRLLVEQQTQTTEEADHACDNQR